MAEPQFFAVADRDEIGPGEVFTTIVEGVPVAVCNVEGRFYAIADICTHDGSSFEMTELDGEEITCPRHGAVFDVTTGEALSAPAYVPVPTYPVRVRGTIVEVGIEP